MRKVEYLLQRGCNPNKKVERYYTDCNALCLALKKSKGSSKKMIELLLQYGGDVSSAIGVVTSKRQKGSPREGICATILAARIRNMDILKLILQSRPSKQDKIEGNSNYYILYISRVTRYQTIWGRYLRANIFTFIIILSLKYLLIGLLCLVEEGDDVFMEVLLQDLYATELVTADDIVYLLK